MPDNKDTVAFHYTTTKELLAIKDRIRHLLTNQWREDGAYKEVILKSVIKRFMPEKYAIATGFVIRAKGTRGEHETSNQIDLIIYDKSYPAFFKESDFVIITADAVKAIIEVKANVEKQNLKNRIKQANKNGRFIFEGRADKDSILFNGIFSYEGFTEEQIETIKDHIIKANEETVANGLPLFRINHMSLNKDLFYKYWLDNVDPDNRGSYLYKIEDLSFSYFISNLMWHLSDTSIKENSFIWFPRDKSLNTLTSFEKPNQNR